MNTLPLKVQEKEVNEGGWGRRCRLRGNALAEELAERGRTFIASRVESHKKVGEAIQSVVASEVRGKEEASGEVSVRWVERVPESVLEEVRGLYSSFLLLVEDACNAAGYLYTMQGVLPSLFDPVAPFTPTEWLLLSGNVALPSFPLTPPSEEVGDGVGDVKSTVGGVKSTVGGVNGVKSTVGGEKTVGGVNGVNTTHTTDIPTKQQQQQQQQQEKPLHEVSGLFGLSGHRVEDPRCCDLCGLAGDHAVAGRLLCIQTGEWVHLNCVYYSSAITLDERTGAIQKYTQLKNHCRNTLCCVCNKPGASIKCCCAGCPRCFHFVCGRENGCFIRVNREAFCQRHRPGVQRPRGLEGGECVCGQ